jgi:electron transport complex protein RnfE
MSDKRKTLKTIRNSAIIKNPLLFEAIGLCSVVALARSLKLALFLACVTMVQMIICEVLTSLLLKNVKRYWRVALYVVFSVAVVFPIMYLTLRFFPNIAVNFGIFLPLMAVNSLIALHCERVAVKSDVKKSFIDAVSASLSYGVVAIILGILREFLSNGTVWDIELNLPVKISALKTPFGGLLIIGFLAAGLKAFVNAKYPEASPEKSFDLSEIRRSHRGSIQELLNEEFNPYGEDEDEVFSVREHKKKIKKSKIKLSNDSEKVNDTPIFEEEKEKTYLDEFSEILSDLENSKAPENNDGGDK